MKILKKTIPKRTVTSFQCEVCDTKYRTREKAQGCEKRKEEPTGFAVGDRVLVEAHCNCAKSLISFLNGKRPWLKGRVIKKMGPFLPDKGYETEVIQIPSRLKMHVFQYDVVNKCHCCKKKVTARLYAPEIQIRQI